MERLGDVLKSYLKDDKPEFAGRRQYSHDPDMQAAYDELDQFLNGRSGGGSSGTFRPEGNFSKTAERSKTQEKPAVPETLRADFTELGVSFGAGAEECKIAHKKLLKIHHPDRHAGHEGNMKKATAKSARINSSYERIRLWRETGRV
ncbi:hypothetical protein AGMMS50212_15020 [Spirochaetia bacterium]|nr:hypothetical protein AGMMS50212_15020 [Spirochaetia bacterium]